MEESETMFPVLTRFDAIELAAVRAALADYGQTELGLGGGVRFLVREYLKSVGRLPVEHGA